MQLLDILAEAVTVRDADGTIAFANRAALRLLGFDTVEELRRRSSSEIMDDYLVEDQHGNPLSMSDVPSVRLMQGEDAPPLLMRTINRRTGAMSWRMLKTAALPGDEGAPMAAVTVIEDVTAVKLAETRMRVLADSGRLLAASLDYQQTLRNVAGVAVPALADWCSVDLVDSHGRREHVVVAHPDSRRHQLAAQLREYEPEEIDPASPVGRVIRTGIPELFAEITDAQLEASARNPEHLRLLRELELRSVVLVPMLVGAQIIGVMTLVTAESRRLLDHEDVELAEQLGRRAAVAVENARLHTTLSQVADTLQQSLRPDELPEVPGWCIASLYEPAEAERRIDVGGDFYEVLEVPDGWVVLIGDVTGKGIHAATLTSLMRHGARFAAQSDSRPSAILSQLDSALRSRPGGSLCTALCLRLEHDQLLIASAGHPLALRVSVDGEVGELGSSGPLLGAFDDATWPEQSTTVRSDEMLLLYTDGVTEARGQGSWGPPRYGTERLQRLVQACAAAQPQELLDALERDLAAFRGTHGPTDDVAALAMRPG